MARLKELAKSRGKENLYFDPREIKEKPGYNVRDMNSPATIEYIRQMADSIHANGILSFPAVTISQEGGEVYVYRGHCRRRAFALAMEEGADIKGILCVEHGLNEQDSVLDLLSSNEGLPLTPLEKAKAVDRLLHYGWTPAEIAKKRGCSVGVIQNLMALINSTQEVKEMVQNGEVSATSAAQVIRKKGNKQAGEVLQTAIKTAKGQGKKKATAKHMPFLKSRDEESFKEGLACGIIHAMAILSRDEGMPQQALAILRRCDMTISCASELDLQELRKYDSSIPVGSSRRIG